VGCKAVLKTSDCSGRVHRFSNMVWISKRCARRCNWGFWCGSAEKSLGVVRSGFRSFAKLKQRRSSDQPNSIIRCQFARVLCFFTLPVRSTRTFYFTFNAVIIVFTLHPVSGSSHQGYNSTNRMRFHSIFPRTQDSFKPLLHHLSDTRRAILVQRMSLNVKAWPACILQGASECDLVAEQRTVETENVRDMGRAYITIPRTQFNPYPHLSLGVTICEQNF
jgi:hypothetical protein